MQAAGIWAQNKVGVQGGSGPPPRGPPGLQVLPGNAGIRRLDSGRQGGTGQAAPCPPSPDPLRGPLPRRRPGDPTLGTHPCVLLLFPSPSPCLASLGSLNARTWAQALLGTSRHVQLLPAGLQGPHGREPGALEAPARTGPRDGREEGAENRRKTRDKSAGGNGLRVAGSAVAPRSPASSWQVSPSLTWLSVQWPGPWPVQGRSGTEGAQSGAARSELSERRRDGWPTWPRSHTFSPGTNFWGPGFETSDRTTTQKAGTWQAASWTETAVSTARAPRLESGTPRL